MNMEQFRSSIQAVRKHLPGYTPPLTEADTLAARQYADELFATKKWERSEDKFPVYRRRTLLRRLVPHRREPQSRNARPAFGTTQTRREVIRALVYMGIGAGGAGVLFQACEMVDPKTKVVYKERAPLVVSTSAPSETPQIGPLVPPAAPAPTAVQR